jgi:hypothetical protein
MANERQQHSSHTRLQEALDDALSPEAVEKLRQQLDRDPDQAALFSRLKQVDRMLRASPLERAPTTLALGIMARLAEGLQQRPVRASGLALALALALIAGVLLPVLVGFGWLILTLLGNPAALGQAISGLTTLLANVMTALDNLVQSAQRVLETYPEAPALALAAIPASIFMLVRSARQHRATERQRVAESRLGDTRLGDTHLGETPTSSADVDASAEIRAASRLGQQADSRREGD